jgi:hypothetical protein
VTCSGPIYLSSKFQGIWRSSSSGPNYWALTGFRRAQLHLRIQHLEEHLLAFRFETSGGGSTHPDLSFYWIWESFGSFHQLGRNIGSSQLFRRMCHQPGGFGLDPGYYIGLHIVFILWRLISSCWEHFVATHILSTGSI